MTDQSPNVTPAAQAPGLPPMVAGIGERVVHQLAGGVVALLIAHGFLAKTQSVEAIDVLSSVLVTAAGFAVAWLQARRTRARVAAALNAAAPQVPVKP